MSAGVVPSLRRSWIIWAVAAIFYLYQFVLRVSPSVMAHELITDFHVDACSLGLLTSFYYYAYAGLQLPVGTLLDLYGPRRLLIFAALLCTAGSLLFANADHLWVGSLGRFLIGAGSGFGFLSCMKLGTLWFPPYRISLIVGLTLLLGTAGGMLGSYPLSFLVDGFGWRNAVYATAGGGVILAGLIALVVRDTPPAPLKRYIEDHHALGNPKLSLLEGLKVIVKKGQTWLLASYVICMYVPLAGFADMWGVPFLTEVHQLDKQSASFSTLIFYFGVGLGTPLFAFLSDKLEKFKPALTISSLGAFGIFALVIYGSFLSPWMIHVSLFLAGLFLGGQFMAYSIVVEINPLSVSGMALGFQNMIGLSSGIIFQPLIGKLLDLFWEGATAEGLRLYSSATFKIALSSLLVSMGIAILLSLFIKEAYPEKE